MENCNPNLDLAKAKLFLKKKPADGKFSRVHATLQVILVFGDAFDIL